MSSQFKTYGMNYCALTNYFSRRPGDVFPAIVEEFEQRARKWGKDFISEYHSTNVTPYIHAMMNHVPEFMSLHGSILPFTQQGLEKYNDVVTKDYFRSTSHHGQKALHQIMEKQNRLEYLRDIGAQADKKFAITCSNCKGKGHNKLTCTEKCSKCNAPQYCLHLVSVGGKKVPSCDIENSE